MNILLIMPPFFQYHQKIKNTIQSKGHNVTLCKDSFAMSFSNRLKLKLFKNTSIKLFDKYFNEMINSINESKFDIVILIFGKNYTSKHINILKDKYSNAKFVYYVWDSIVNFPNIIEFYSSFDRYISFDKKDCEKYGFEFLPLFYSDECFDVKEEYDYSSLMTVSKYKMKDFNMVMNCIPKELIGNNYLYLKHKSSFVYNKIFHKNIYAGYKMNDFHYKPLTPEESTKLLASAKAVIDIPMKNQNGLTIRTFEALHLNKKIITTNENIKTYDFYCKENIFIINEEKKIPIEFFNSSFNKDFSLGEKYSINSFIDELLK